MAAPHAVARYGAFHLPFHHQTSRRTALGCGETRRWNCLLVLPYRSLRRTPLKREDSIIYVVDDDARVREALEAFLRSSRRKVKTFASATHQARIRTWGALAGSSSLRIAWSCSSAISSRFRAFTCLGFKHLS